jgi:hypothetical protein
VDDFHKGGNGVNFWCALFLVKGRKKDATERTAAVGEVGLYRQLFIQQTKFLI